MEIELSAAVAALRDELLNAATKASTSDMEFVVGPIELEFAVELKQDVKAKAGFKAWVVSGDVQAGIARSHTHRIKLALTPRKPGGGEFLVTSSEARPAPEVDELAGHIGR